ncbi:hypothetical protein [Polaribacter sp. Hel_I_88]|uniref:hypothetical protein n=1 Tax=Polaribacter sp. Hel_I_88 TaxID=1250006 RepID=UPI00047B971D|nr:hypothetical protein [Polaribacter sp. Hel_I_88]
MKNILLVFGFIFIASSSFAQKKDALKSFEVKNAKVSKYVSQNTVITINSTKSNLKSYEFKNHKIWENKKEDSEVVTIETSKRSKLMGPKYKNFKH